MLTMQRTTIQTKTVNYKNTQKYGGYGVYWKLYREFLKLSKHLKLNILMKLKNFIWFCLLKPLGGLITTITKYDGTFKVTNGHFKNESVVKTVCIYFLFIPFFYSSTTKMKEKDIEKLTA